MGAEMKPSEPERGRQPIGGLEWLMTGLWMLLVLAGLGGLAYYSLAPGRNAEAPATLGASKLVRVEGGRPTLVMLVHPKCACSRASLAELAVLMTHVQGRVNAKVLMARPTGAEPGWVSTSLWRQAEGIPGVEVEVDEGGEEARRLGVTTSGDTLLFDASGRLVFEGGITLSRGHEGSSAGRRAILDYLLEGRRERAQTPVFGCPIFEGPDGSGDTVQREPPRSIGAAGAEGNG